jgi:hypothetical protein
MITLKDHEISFADSAEGQRHIAHERRKHYNREAHKGANALPWTDAMEATATRNGALAHARGALAAAHNALEYPKRLADAQVLRDAAAAARKHKIANAWKGH